MNNRSRSTLFLIEQLIVIAVFAICAVACVSILATAFFYAGDSNAAGNALIAAESGAEIFKATGGDFGAVADMLGGAAEGSGSSGSVVVYYDKAWQVCGIADARYFLHFVGVTPDASPGSNLVAGEMIVAKITGEELVAFPVAAREAN